MTALARVAWLFVRGDHTIHVSLSDDGCSVSANGPIQERRVFRFGDQMTANEFLALYEHYLVHSGWMLQAFIERRSREAGMSLPPEGDRRSAASVH